MIFYSPEEIVTSGRIKLTVYNIIYLFISEPNHYSNIILYKYKLLFINPFKIFNPTYNNMQIIFFKYNFISKYKFIYLKKK